MTWWLVVSGNSSCSSSEAEIVDVDANEIWLATPMQDLFKNIWKTGVTDLTVYFGEAINGRFFILTRYNDDVAVLWTRLHEGISGIFGVMDGKR